MPAHSPEELDQLFSEALNAGDPLPSPVSFFTWLFYNGPM